MTQVLGLIVRNDFGHRSIVEVIPESGDVEAVRCLIRCLIRVRMASLAGDLVGYVIPVLGVEDGSALCDFCEGGGRLYTWAFNPDPRSVEFPRASDLTQKSRVCPRCEGTGRQAVKP